MRATKGGDGTARPSKAYVFAANPGLPFMGKMPSSYLDEASPNLGQTSGSGP